MRNFFRFPDDYLAGRIRWREFAVSFAGGTAYAAALPPCNLEALAFVCQVPALFCIVNAPSWRRGALLGWVWSMGWALFAFQFLREIEAPIPYLLAPVVSLWAAVWGALLPGLWRWTVFPLKTMLGGYETRMELLDRGVGFFRLLSFVFAAAALFTLLEWSRSRLFTWNDFGATQYLNLPLLQLAAVTGGYGVNFCVALGNTALFALLVKRGWRVALAAGMLPVAVTAGGFFALAADRPESRPANFRPTLIQGDLSQRRRATEQQAVEALEVYFRLSSEAARQNPKPELIVWPESAVPVMLRSTRNLSALYRKMLREFQTREKIPMLIGAIDFEDVLPGVAPGVTNSALYFDAENRLRYKYDKIHRVPFGEYIPFRRFLPEALTSRIDMGRDLTAGKNPSPPELPGGVRPGIAICYEGVFGYLTRKFARRGANVLMVLSNDAWYPESSEPEQHLANAVMRAVETGLPMVRSGNNGGSGVVLPTGKFVQCLELPGGGRPELRRGRAFGTVEVRAYDRAPTFFVRYGEWLILILTLTVSGVGVFALGNYMKYRRILAEKQEKIRCSEH